MLIHRLLLSLLLLVGTIAGILAQGKATPITLGCSPFLGPCGKTLSRLLIANLTAGGHVKTRSYDEVNTAITKLSLHAVNPKDIVIAQQLGKALNVQYLLVGTSREIFPAEPGYLLQVRLLEVQTAAFVPAGEQRVIIDGMTMARMEAQIAQLGDSLLVTMGVLPAPVVMQPVVQPATLPATASLACLPFQCPHGKTISRTLAEKLTGKQLTLCPTTDISALAGTALGFKDVLAAQQLGKLLNVKYLLVGTVNEVFPAEPYYRLQVRLLAVQSGEFVPDCSQRTFLDGSQPEHMAESLTRMAKELLPKIATATQAK